MGPKAAIGRHGARLNDLGLWGDFYSISNFVFGSANRDGNKGSVIEIYSRFEVHNDRILEQEEVVILPPSMRHYHKLASLLTNLSQRPSPSLQSLLPLPTYRTNSQ